MMQHLQCHLGQQLDQPQSESLIEQTALKCFHHTPAPAICLFFEVNKKNKTNKVNKLFLYYTSDILDFSTLRPLLLKAVP